MGWLGEARPQVGRWQGKQVRQRRVGLVAEQGSWDPLGVDELLQNPTAGGRYVQATGACNRAS